MRSFAGVLDQKSVSYHERTFPWSQIVEVIATAFRFTSEEKKCFEAKDLARLIGAIPFLADCKDPLRTAISHLGTYVLSVKLKEIANARPSDDEYLFRRLELLGNYIGGDRSIIKRGMNLIALCMLSNYAHDAQADEQSGKYNPVVMGTIDVEAMRADLTVEIVAFPCSDMDRIMTPKAAWDWGRFWIY